MGKFDPLPVAMMFGLKTTLASLILVLFCCDLTESQGTDTSVAKVLRYLKDELEEVQGRRNRAKRYWNNAKREARRGHRINKSNLIDSLNEAIEYESETEEKMQEVCITVTDNENLGEDFQEIVYSLWNGALARRRVQNHLLQVEKRADANLQRWAARYRLGQELDRAQHDMDTDIRHMRTTIRLVDNFGRGDLTSTWPPIWGV